MTVEVFIEQLPSGGYRATVLGSLGGTAEGATEQQALARLRQLTQDRLTQGKIVVLDLAQPAPTNPWLAMSERFCDDAMLDEVDEAIAAYRRELDEADEAYWRELDSVTTPS